MTASALAFLNWFDEATERQWVASVGAVIVFFSAIFVLSAGLNRNPPVTFISVEPASGRPGEFITIKQKIIRDKTRDCVMRSVRNATDATGLDVMVGIRKLSDAERDRLERDFPGLSVTQIQIPYKFAAGPAVLTYDMEWTCHITQRLLWPGPIEQIRSVPFEVLP